VIAANQIIRLPSIPRREFVALIAYLECGSHRAGAHRLGISESTSRQRISSLIRRLGVRTTAQAVWVLREVLEGERRERVTG
jgi:DNA-binding NarL/FixJ family response regulator